MFLKDVVAPFSIRTTKTTQVDKFSEAVTTKVSGAKVSSNKVIKVNNIISTKLQDS